MSDAKHTPGPWMAAAKPSSIVGWPVVGPNGRVVSDVAIINRQGNGTGEEFARYYAECEANSHLIAAAPELLALAVRVRALLAHPDSEEHIALLEGEAEDAANQERHPSLQNVKDETLQLALAAIAKATGDA